MGRGSIQTRPTQPLGRRVGMAEAICCCAVSPEECLLFPVVWMAKSAGQILESAARAHVSIGYGLRHQFPVLAKALGCRCCFDVVTKLPLGMSQSVADGCWGWPIIVPARAGNGATKWHDWRERNRAMSRRDF